MPASISIAEAVKTGRRAAPTARRATRPPTRSSPNCRAMTAPQWPAWMPPSGRATRATPTRPMSVPVHSAGVQRWPPGRRPSRNVSQSGAVPTMRAAMPLGMRLLRPHHEDVPDREEQHAHQRVVGDLPPGRPPMAPVHDGGDAGHGDAGSEEAQRARAEGRHLAHGDADGEVGRAPHHVDEAQRDPRQQTAMTGGHG